MKNRSAKEEKIAALLDAFKGNTTKIREINKLDVVFVREVNGELVNGKGEKVDVTRYKTVVRIQRRIISKEHPEGIIS
jgi:hypothetical protein